MVFRASKHILRRLVRHLQPEHVACAVSHFLNCLVGTGYNATPSAIHHPLDLTPEPRPSYVGLTPDSLRAEIITQIRCRFRWNLDEAYLIFGLRRSQLLRELAMRFGFQLLQRDYTFVKAVEKDPEEDKENRPHGKEKDKKKKSAVAIRPTTFEPTDFLTLIPIVWSTAPAVS